MSKKIKIAIIDGPGIKMIDKDGVLTKNGYTFWYKASVVEKYIFEYISKTFPDDLVIPEFCLIDYFVLGKDIPIEIQSTLLKPTGSPAHANFEKNIRSQLEQNIKIYNICWFIFDSEYLRYLQNDIEKNISINYDWLYKLIRDGKLKVFTCSHEGKIEEKTSKEFEFIKKYSSTCTLEENSDERILQRNKSKIMYNIFNNVSLKSEDILKLRNKLLQIKRERNLKGTFYQFSHYLEDPNEKSICNIYRILGGELNIINNALDCKIENDERSSRMVIWHFDVLGLTEQIGGGQQKTLRRFVDDNNIGQYLPGYIRNKEKWDYLKESKMNLTKRQLDAIMMGKINPLDWKKLTNSGW